jgi:hypothetical protein
VVKKLNKDTLKACYLQEQTELEDQEKEEARRLASNVEVKPKRSWTERTLSLLNISRSHQTEV